MTAAEALKRIMEYLEGEILTFGKHQLIRDCRDTIEAELASKDSRIAELEAWLLTSQHEHKVALERIRELEGAYKLRDGEPRLLIEP